MIEALTRNEAIATLIVDGGAILAAGYLDATYGSQERGASWGSLAARAKPAVYPGPPGRAYTW